MIDSWIREIAVRIGHMPGVVAVVLGGSRATHSATAASDVDLGIYYHGEVPLDISALTALAKDIDDAHRDGLVTPIGGWGPRINGGGWLSVNGVPVDFIYRDLAVVDRVIDRCQAGEIEIDYQAGHPHAFCSAIYMGEAAMCIPLFENDTRLQALIARTRPYPQALRNRLLSTFGFEIEFSLQMAAKQNSVRDVSYFMGCLFRATACIAQVLFALNRIYLLNEKGAITRAASLKLAPQNLGERVSSAFHHAQQDPGQSIMVLDTLRLEVAAMVERDRANC